MMKIQNIKKLKKQKFMNNSCYLLFNLFIFRINTTNKTKQKQTTMKLIKRGEKNNVFESIFYFEKKLFLN